jgi:hypothetical protein
METKSTNYKNHIITNKLDIILSYLLILYPLIFLISNVNLGSLLIGLSCIYILYNYKNLYFEQYINFFTITLALILTLSIYKGILNGYRKQEIIQELYYYSKSIIFYFLGIINITPYKTSNFLKNITEIIFTGTIIFFTFPELFVEAAHIKSGIGSGWGHFTSFNFLLRSGSIFLSPLETAFVSSFIGIYFFYYRNSIKNGNLYFYVSTLCLLLSITRSVTIIYSICIIYIYLKKRNLVSFKWASWAIPLTLSILVTLVGLYLKEIIIKNDGSIMLHFENLTNILTHIKYNPFGYGMSSSGYASVLAGRDNLYSEGSFFTYIIECGIQSIILFLILAYISIKKGTLAQSLFVFFILVSFVLPIGFSTPFCFLYFGYLGNLIIKDESNNLNNKL